MSTAGEAFERYCKVMGYQNDEVESLKDVWLKALEFTAFVGKGLVDLKEIDHNTSLGDQVKEKYLDRIRHMLNIVNGPHGETIIKAYKARRYSRWGKIKTPFIKVNHLITILFLVYKAAIADWFRGEIRIRKPW